MISFDSILPIFPKFVLDDMFSRYKCWLLWDLRPSRAVQGEVVGGVGHRAGRSGQYPRIQVVGSAQNRHLATSAGGGLVAQPVCADSPVE